MSALESIVPNGSFILGDTQGWVTSGFNYGTDGRGVFIYSLAEGQSLRAQSPSFAVVPGQKYRLSYKLFNGSGSGGIFARIAYQATYAANIVGGTDYEDFISNGSVTTTPTIYTFDWTCPAGMNYASMNVYCVFASDLARQYVSCVPSAAGQWGADVTGENTALDTVFVNGVPAGDISPIAGLQFQGV